MTKDSYQLDIEEQIDHLKGLVTKIGDRPDPIDVTRATIAAEFVLGRIREFCQMSLTRGGVDGMDSTAA